ncbi:hypothetical protein [uncultured Thiodictyon sp.]|uniref:hypothetical protein n=1 Tax=uncultured Thiodictyon sp. TaxID=1846217 RepID=UPI0025DD5522|nr:hypothetical protein [uncultured Thiodictyon sp.]
MRRATAPLETNTGCRCRLAVAVQLLIAGAAIDIALRQVREMRSAQAPFRGQPPLVVGDRKADGDTGLRTLGQQPLAEVAGIGHGEQFAGRQDRLRGDGLGGQLFGVVACIGDLMVGDKPVLAIHHCWTL